MIIAEISFWQGVEHLVALSLLGGFIISVMAFLRKKETRKIEPDPLNVRVRQKTAKEQDCKDRHESAMEAIQRIAESNDDEHKRLYDQIDVIERRGADALKESMVQINATLRTMPQEMLDLLKKTGQLRDHDRRRGL